MHKQHIIEADKISIFTNNPKSKHTKEGGGQKEFHKENGLAYTSNGWQAVNWGSWKKCDIKEKRSRTMFEFYNSGTKVKECITL